MPKERMLKRRRGRTVKPVDYQKGRSNTKRDEERDALAPGERISASGNAYFETRKNRSDRGKGRV